MAPAQQRQQSPALALSPEVECSDRSHEAAVPAALGRPGVKGSKGPSSGRMPSRSRPSVIVVGTGFAGLAAARALADGGYKVVVLESRDRIGGRAHTDYSFGFPVDLGAAWAYQGLFEGEAYHANAEALAWLHGASYNNPLAHVIGRLQQPMYKTSEDNSVLYDHDLESFALFTKGGQQVPAEVVERVEAVYEEMLEETRKLCKPLKHDVSMRDAFARVAETRPDLRLTGVEADVLKWYICRMEGWFATDLENLSAQNWEEEVLLEGGHGLMMRGYSPVIHALAEGLDIRLNHRVQEVQYSDAGVRIKTTNGASFSADAAVVTIPVGVLRSHTVQFRPPLPPQKLRAIESIGIGIENKVALLFDSVFWPNVEFIGLVAQSPYECGYFLNLHKPTGAPVLVFMPAGQLAVEMERMSNEETIKFTMLQLRKILPNAADPINHLVTRWASDESSMCSYTYDKVGVSMSVYDDLRAPLGRAVFFAGEATSRAYPGTVHGAYGTGIQAAKECMQALRVKGSLTPSPVLEVAPALSLIQPGGPRLPLIMSRL